LEQSAFTSITVFALSAMIVNSVGIWVIYKNEQWAQKNKEYFMCFAAGVLISSPLIIALPQALGHTENAGLAALAGFVFMFFSNKLIRHKTEHAALAFGLTALVGIGIHSFMDGIIYTVTFSVSTFVGLMAGLGLVVHEFAEGVITFSVLVKGNVDPKKALLYAFLVAGLTTPVGAFLAFPFISRFSSSMLGYALGFVAGVLIFVSASHLLPESEVHVKRHAYVAFMAGIALSLLMMLFE
jgi:zinc and cadmium transporter